MRKLAPALVISFLLVISSGCLQFEEERMDPEDEGIEEEWFRQEWAERIGLPGAMAEAGYGHDVTAETKWTGSIVTQECHEAGSKPKSKKKALKLPKPSPKLTSSTWPKRKESFIGTKNFLYDSILKN